jgi:hypothetical protein
MLKNEQWVMKKSNLLLLFLLGLFIAIVASIWVDVPGYMDAEYYYANGIFLESGLGFREEFIWNYLNDPSGLPTTSHQYWMPATSIISSLSMAIFGTGFKMAQIPFILLTGFVPPISAAIAYKLHKDERLAGISGLLAVFSGFFLPRMVTTDTFAIYMILGAGAFWYMSEAVMKRQEKLWIVVGLAAGLAHLSRVDGVLLLGIAILAIWLMMENRLKTTAFFLLGYLLIMLPWWLYNLDATGTIMSPNSTKVLWTLSYDELFSYPSAKLTIEHWLNAGIGEIVRVRLDALLQNIQSLVLVNGMVFLGPFMVIGAVRFKERPLIRLCAGYLGLLLIIMSFIFPFAGARGGFFHSASAVMPFLWVLAPIGLDESIKFGAEKRGWDLIGAQKVFGAAAVILALSMTVGLFYIRVIGPGGEETIWSSSHAVYESVDQWFKNSDLEDQLVAINNPPGFYVASGMQSVVIPDGGLRELREVIELFGVEWVVLDSSNPGLMDLYENPGMVSWLMHAITLEPLPKSRIQIYRVVID